MEASKAAFFAELQALHVPTHDNHCSFQKKKQTFRATRSGAQNCAPQNEKKHLRTTVYNKEEVGEILVFHFPNPRIGVRQLSKTPTCTAHQTIVNPKFSAQSEPMVKSYDQNKFQAFSLKEND